MEGSSTNSINSIYFTRDDLATYIDNGDITRIGKEVGAGDTNEVLCKNVVSFLNGIMKNSLECSGRGGLSFACSLKETSLANHGNAFQRINGIAITLFSKRDMVYLSSYTSPMGCVIKWSPDNSYLNPKPIMRALPANPGMYREDYWKFFKEQIMTDVTFVINGEEIKAHKVFLLVSPFFRMMFASGMKESSSIASIPLESISSRAVFEQLMKHLYCGQVDAEFLKDRHQCIELLAIAHEYGLDNLVKQCAKHLEGEIHLPVDGKPMDPDFLLAIANSACAINHPELIKLCQWYLKATPAFHKTVDLLKDKTTEEVLQLIGTARTLGSDSLEKTYYKHLETNCISLDSFVTIAQYAIHNKNKQLRSISKIFGRKHYDEIRSKMESTYKKHWELYDKITTVPVEHPDYKLTFEESKGKEKIGV